jgi:hypothetical protein
MESMHGARQTFAVATAHLNEAPDHCRLQRVPIARRLVLQSQAGGSSGIPPALRVASPMHFSPAMKDLVLIAVAAGFFAVTWLYVRSFDRL